MIKTKEYEELTHYCNLPERFRAGDYMIDEVMHVASTAFVKSAKLRNRLSDKSE